MRVKNIFLGAFLLALLPASCSDSDYSTLNFGPADTLWKLQAFRLTDGTVIDVPDPDGYTILFDRSGAVNMRADCNTCNGEYALSGGLFRMIVYDCTRAACPAGSLDVRYVTALNIANAFLMDGDVLTLTYLGRVLIFHS
jgi:heat shock protein HslJ